MIEPRGRTVWVKLPPNEVSLLVSIPDWLADVGSDPKDPAGPRLNQSAYPDDPIASAEYEVAHGAVVEEARQEDREAFAATLAAAVDGVGLSEDEASAWMRVVGDARLALAARIGIEDDRWQRRVTKSPQMLLVHYLTHIQSSIIDALDALMEE